MSRNIISRLSNKLTFKFKQFSKTFFAKKINKAHFSIVANDCLGGEIYRLASKKFNTPFIGLMIMGPCYIKLLQNLRSHLKQPIVFINSSKYAERNAARATDGMYPIGVLGEIEIHFLHYKTQEEAVEKWAKRIARIEWDNLFVVYSIEKDYSTIQEAIKFDELNFLNKVCFGPNKLNQLSNYIQVPGLEKDATKAFRQIPKYFDIVYWLSSDTINRKGFWSKMQQNWLYYTIN